MKLLIIYPNRVMVIRAPLGLGYMASYLKNAGHEMKLFDTTFIKCADIASDDILRERGLQVTNPNLESLNIIEQKINVYDELRQQIDSS